MTEKPLSILWSLAPNAREAYLKELNLLNQKYRVLSTTSVQLHGGELHKSTQSDFDRASIGAASSENNKARNAVSLVSRTKNIRSRNIAMAKRFRERWVKLRETGSSKSASDLKADIGAAEAELGRSAAIDAINDGLRLLGEE